MSDIGLNISAIEGRNDRKDMKRSDWILLVKNIRSDMTENTLWDMFARYGRVVSCLLSPSHTMAVVEYKAAGRAKTALERFST